MSSRSYWRPFERTAANRETVENRDAKTARGILELPVIWHI